MWKVLFVLIGIALILAGYWVYDSHFNKHRPGRALDKYQGVVVYENGLDYLKSHGRHFAKDGYYYGQKWQCVEYIKRFYHQAFNHHMPEVMGHATSFFDQTVPHAQFNVARCMWQYRQGENEAPRPNDLLVFANDMYGHVAVVTEVGPDYVEVIQQNILGKPRERLPLDRTDGFKVFRASGTIAAAGWLRLPTASEPLKAL